MTAVKNELTEFLLGIRTPYVVMGVGLPRTKKSGHLGAMGRELGATVLSPRAISDQLRRHGVEGPGVTERELGARVAQLLSDGEPVIVDALHVDRPTQDPDAFVKSRPEKVQQFKRFGAKSVMAIVFDHGVDAVMSRFPQTEHTTNRNVLRLARNLSERPVRLDEGFDIIARQEVLDGPIRIVDFVRPE